MATSSSSSGIVFLFAIAVLSSFFVSGASARPCKTLFITYAFDNSGDEYASASIEVTQISGLYDHRPSRFMAVYRLIPLRSYALPRRSIDSDQYFGISSLRERARDILAVVAGLLFGVGCAALTSASVYLAWYLIYSRYETQRIDGYDYLDEDERLDAMESPKKMGYVGIPASPASPVAPLKEAS
ncbi:uncharacterized protein LOC144710728 [Wolffia australiana]